jgi:hypothetical protein
VRSLDGISHAVPHYFAQLQFEMPGVSNQRRLVPPLHPPGFSEGCQDFLAASPTHSHGSIARLKPKALSATEAELEGC